ncbi:MAG: 50S ribosomal protein L18 [Planctomycetes bacterium]|nr:50S ribosomal protein L18 [Planctomycetota bacterium]
MKKAKRKAHLHRRRHRSVRKKVGGSAERPRLCVSRSNKHIYAQVIDDWDQKTLVAASTLSPEIRDEIGSGGNIQSAVRVGRLVAQKCLEHGIKAVVFDRGGYSYHGRVKALAEAAREQFKEAGAEGF